MVSGCVGQWLRPSVAASARGDDVIVAGELRRKVEIDHLLQLGNVPSRFTCFVRTGCPLKLTWENDGERHMSTIPAAADSRA